MPVILPSRLWEAWLGPDEDVDGLLEVVRNAEVPRLEARTISDRVNNVRNKGPELLEPGTID
jgi:putative SOS response-associated peptidase YedK